MTVPIGHVLITSASIKAPLIRAMRDAAQRTDPTIKVIAGDIDPEAPAQYVADQYWQMPRAEVDALPTILSGCAERGIRMILPTRDGELAFWAAHRAYFLEQGIKVIVSKPETVACCLDKLAFAQFGNTNDLPVIPATDDLETLNTDRVVVKERFGAGSEGIGLDLDRSAATAHAKKLNTPIFQPYFPGAEISIDAWVNYDGVPFGLVLRSRDRVVRGESMISTTFRDPALEAEARRSLAAFSLYGPVVMQAIMTKTSKLAIIEINARFGGASTTSLAVGLDSFFWSLNSSFAELQEPFAFYRLDHEVRQIRLPADIFVEDP